MTTKDSPPAPRLPTPSAIRTYKRRASRVTTGQRGALGRLWSTYGLTVDGTPLDLAVLFGRDAPLALEIGFGMGEATAEMAGADPATDLLAVDVHTPGQGNLLRLAELAGLTNVRVADGDALVLLRHMLGGASLAAIRVFFPDPWPKTRHHKRRLVTDQFLALCADRLVDGGLLHVATDVDSYAELVAAGLARSRQFSGLRPPWRAATRFEGQALRAGRTCHDLAAVRVAR